MFFLNRWYINFLDYIFFSFRWKLQRKWSWEWYMFSLSVHLWGRAVYLLSDISGSIAHWGRMTTWNIQHRGELFGNSIHYSDRSVMKAHFRKKGNNNSERLLGASHCSNGFMCLNTFAPSQKLDDGTIIIPICRWKVSHAQSLLALDFGAFLPLSMTG